MHDLCLIITLKDNLLYYIRMIPFRANKAGERAITNYFDKQIITLRGGTLYINYCII